MLIGRKIEDQEWKNILLGPNKENLSTVFFTVKQKQLKWKLQIYSFTVDAESVDYL